MKIIVAHPGKQHSFRTAEAFNIYGGLFRYITTVYDKPKSLTSFLKIFLIGNAKKKSSTRKTNIIPNCEIVQFNEFLGILILLLVRLPRLKKFYIYLNNLLQDSFGKKVARYAIGNNVDAVIMYDTTSNKCWEILKKEAPHIKRILDVSIASRLFMKENFIKNINETQDFNLKIEQRHLWNDSNIDRYKREFRDSQKFLVASNMVKDSLIFSNVNEISISLIAYGVDSDQFQFIMKSAIRKPLKLIYVGEISYRKGIHNLLKVVSLFCKDEVELILCGRYDVNSELYRNYKDCQNIKFLGFVTRDELSKKYQSSDVFVFATLGEGFGLVILEALSCGLPCIVSDLAGGNDAIKDGYNGFVFNGGNNKELKSKIQWFIDNPNELPKMSDNSKMSSQNYTWEKYYKEVYCAVNEFISK